MIETKKSRLEIIKNQPTNKSKNLNYSTMLRYMPILQQTYYPYIALQR